MQHLRCCFAVSSLAISKRGLLFHYNRGSINSINFSTKLEQRISILWRCSQKVRQNREHRRMYWPAVKAFARIQWSIFRRIRGRLQLILYRIHHLVLFDTPSPWEAEPTLPCKTQSNIAFSSALPWQSLFIYSIKWSSCTRSRSERRRRSSKKFISNVITL